MNERLVTLARFLRNQVGLADRPPPGCIQLNNAEALLCAEALERSSGETGRAPLVEELVSQCEAYHDALDMMFARMIEKTTNDAPHCFYPSKSGQPWAAVQSGRALIQRVRAAQKTSGK